MQEGRKTEKERALGAYNKQYKQRCCKYGKYSHKPGDQKCPENKIGKEEKYKNTEKIKTWQVIYVNKSKER